MFFVDLSLPVKILICKTIFMSLWLWQLDRNPWKLSRMSFRKNFILQNFLATCRHIHTWMRYSNRKNETMWRHPMVFSLNLMGKYSCRKSIHVLILIPIPGSGDYYPHFGICYQFTQLYKTLIQKKKVDGQDWNSHKSNQWTPYNYYTQLL